MAVTCPTATPDGRGLSRTRCFAAGARSRAGQGPPAREGARCRAGQQEKGKGGEQNPRSPYCVGITNVNILINIICPFTLQNMYIFIRMGSYRAYRFVTGFFHSTIYCDPVSRAMLVSCILSVGLLFCCMTES